MRISGHRDAPAGLLRPLLPGLILPFLLSSCRLLFVVEGEGFVVSASSQAIYQHGAIIEIDGAFSDIFRPLPYPGHSFSGWGALCRNQPVECPVQIPESLVSFDVDGELEPRFLSGYDGPLRHTGGSFYDSDVPDSGRLTIPLEDLDIEGLASGDNSLQLYLASRELDFLLAGERVGGSFEFSLVEPGFSYSDLWLLVSAVDSDGRLATVGLEAETPLTADAASLRAFRSDSPYADVLAGCAKVMSAFSVCEFSELPLLGMETTNPDLEEVMARLVVSHDWMGVRFQQLMQRMPDDMLQMFRGVTAIVISANVRPSFYYPLTGAIHIDPALIWLLNEEKATVSKAPDFRANFGDELDFRYFAEYLEGIFAAFELFSLEDNRERSLRDAERLFGIVMYHELAHANDFAPPLRMGTLSPTDSMLEAYAANEPYSATAVLEATSPLRADLVKEMAAISFGGLEPSASQKQVTAFQVGTAFGGDLAVDYYGHYTGFEDTAMLVDQVMSRHHFGIDYLSAFVTRPAIESLAACDDYRVGWGQLGRIGDPAVSARAELVMQVILGRSDVSSYFANLPPARTLQVGTGYCTAAGRALVGASAPQRLRQPYTGRLPELPVKRVPRVLRLYQ